MAAADVVVGNLVAEIEGEIDALVPQIGERIREEIPDFRRLPAETLGRAIRGNVGRALTALRDLRPPTGAELEQAAEVGRERAEQGLTVDAVLHAYRISVTAVWSRFGELARCQHPSGGRFVVDRPEAHQQRGGAHQHRGSQCRRV